MTIQEAEDIPSLPLRELFRYWSEKKGDCLLPSRSDIKPVELVGQLPYVMLHDVEYSPLRFRCRLIGTEIVQLMGRDITGCYMDEVSRDLAVHNRYKKLIENQKPYYVRCSYDWMGRAHLQYHAVALPLGDERGDVNMILGGVDPVIT